MVVLRKFGARRYAQCLCADRQLRHALLDSLELNPNSNILSYFCSHPFNLDSSSDKSFCPHSRGVLVGDREHQMHRFFFLKKGLLCGKYSFF